MKIRAILLYLFVGAVTGVCYGAAHGVSIAGAIHYQKPAAQVPTVKTTPFDTKSILTAVIEASGTAGTGLKPKDLALVMDDTTYEIDVIRKSNSELFYTLAASGTDVVTTGTLEQQTRYGDLYQHFQTDYKVNVTVGGPNFETIGCGLSVNAKVTGTTQDGLAGSFSGGAAPNQPVQGEIEAGFKTDKKAYTVVTGT